MFERLLNLKIELNWLLLSNLVNNSTDVIKKISAMKEEIAFLERAYEFERNRILK